MELDWLEDFLALSTAGVFARAAESRNISQSAFTRRIRNLEYWAGAPLFDRSVHPVELTAAGKVFKQTANETIKALRIAKSDIRDVSRSEAEVLEFVALHTLAISFFPSWLSRITQHLGPIRTRLVAENFSGCAEAIMAGSADFMLCYYHPAVPAISTESRYPSVTIAKDKLVAVSSASAGGIPRYPLDGSARVPFLSFPPETFLGRISQVSLDRGAYRDTLVPVYENSVAEALRTACRVGHGVAWLPELTARDDLESGDLIKVSAPAAEISLDIKLYRSLERTRPELERLWRLVQSFVEIA